MLLISDKGNKFWRNTICFYSNCIRNQKEHPARQSYAEESETFSTQAHFVLKSRIRTCMFVNNNIFVAQFC